MSGCCGANSTSCDSTVDAAALPDQPVDEAEYQTLLACLREDNQVYDGLSTWSVAQKRQQILLDLSARGLCPNTFEDQLAIYLLEELDFAHQAQLTAAAAFCMRKTLVPSAAYASSLVRAFFSVHSIDRSIVLPLHDNSATLTKSSASAELLRTLTWLGNHAVGVHQELLTARDTISPALMTLYEDALRATKQCCSSQPPTHQQKWTASGSDNAQLPDLQVEDQNGETFSLAEYLIGQHLTILVFFYTRCENRLKCPVTITKLGELQRQVLAAGMETHIRTAAITYDPDFDVPSRLDRYRRTWGAEQGPGFRMLRVLDGGMPTLRTFLDLNVGYGLETVSRHAVELYIVGTNGIPLTALVRQDWTADEVLEQTANLLEPVSQANS